MNTTAAAKTGDPLEHPGFVGGEEEIAVGEERYDSESDDDDVDRYVFLARQPAPAEADDDDDGAMGGGGGKRRLSEILTNASPAAKKARLGLAAPRGASAEESRSQGPVCSAERGILDQGKKNRKRRRFSEEPHAKGAVRGNGSSGAGLEAREGSAQHQDVTAVQKTSAPAAGGAPRRFVCSICGRCFGSHQALGGHVHLGHTKKAKNAITAASHGDVTGDGCRNEKVATMADGAGHGKEKTASPGESDGDGKKTLGAAACRQDVDSSSGDSDSNDEKFIGAAGHGDHRGDGNVEVEKVTVTIATSRDDTGGMESKFAIGRCHKLAAGAIGNANCSIVRKTQHRCEVCGKECLSGQALGGHMRKHRKLSPHNGGKERGSPEVADGAGHGKEKTAVAASSGKSDGDGNKTLSVAAHRQDGDSDSNSSDEEMFIGAADHGDHRGHGNAEGEKVTVAIATSHDDADGTERKFAVRRWDELAAGAIGSANSIVRKTQHRCEVCGKECLSGQALGGHMRKHRKLLPHNGSKEQRSPEVADGTGHGQEKTAVGTSHEKSHGDGKKTLGGAACHQDVDSSSGDSNSNEEEMFIGAAKHGDGNGTERKVAFGRCHELAAGTIGNASSIVRKTQYRCEVCGKECFSGQALGGHMRKHRKRSPQDDGGKRRTSPEADGITNQRAVVIKNPHYGNRFDGSLIGWV